MKERVKYCDFLKAISIILVILIHVFSIYRDLYINSNRVYYTILTLGDSFTRIAVPSFLMITGIFMLKKKPEKSYKEYLLKRLPKLVIPFIIFSIIYYVYEKIKVGETMSLLHFLQILTSYGGAKYHLWFMHIIITIYLLIPFLSVLIKGLKKKELKNLIVLIFIMGNVINYIYLFSHKYDIDLFNGTSLSSLSICINYLLLGYYLYNFDIKKETRVKIYVLGVISILLMPVFDLLYIDDIRNDITFSVSSIFPILPSMACFLLFKYNYHKINISKKLEIIAAKIASVSLYIYMIHVMVLEFVNQFFQKLIPPTRFINSIILIILILITTTILSFIAAFIFDSIYKCVSKKILKIKRLVIKNR